MYDNYERIWEAYINESNHDYWIIQINPHQEHWKRGWLAWDSGSGEFDKVKEVDRAYEFDCPIKAKAMFNKAPFDSGVLIRMPAQKIEGSLP
tara:strand:- start:497 stop:772 length:276 start_codon:yes stop_codon:yes gene_type:complete